MRYAIIVRKVTPKFNPEAITLIVGLGNPDEQYRHTYHNVGWQALDTLAGGAAFEQPGRAPFAAAVLRTGAVLVKPLTGMNVSGSAVRHALRHFSIKDIGTLLVIHDDADLPVGSWKLQCGRGAAGHHGVASIINALENRSFWRARIGIRAESKSTRARRPRAGAFVLAPINRADAAMLRSVFSDIEHSLSLSAARRSR
ncbi:MAG: aminoacyl-tRNA hydrolase [Patescibacteria group bacterium]